MAKIRHFYRDLFCIVFDFKKIFTLKNENKLSFSSLNQIFAVPLHTESRRSYTPSASFINHL